MKKCVFLCVGLVALLSAAFAGGTNQPGSARQNAAPQAPVQVAAGQSVSQSRDIVAACVLDFTSMDPMDTSDTLSGGIQRLMMDGLFGFDDNMKVINLLATSYTANTAATEFTFTLRRGISFTDGVAWNADAFIANLAKWDNKSLALKRTSLLADILDTWAKVDDYTVTVRLTQSFGALINTLAHPACLMMSPTQIAKGVSECAINPVGTGQYTFVEWIRGDHLKLALKKDWWGYDAARTDGKPLAEADAGFKTITFKPVPEGATRTAMIQSGDAQIMWTLPAEGISVLQRDASVSVGIRKSLVAYYVSFNTQKKPFTDKRVRQALNYAFNKEAYLAVVAMGNGALPASIMGPDTQFATNQTPYAFDLAKAKALLAEAGYPNGFKTTLMAANSSDNMKAAEFVKQQFAQVGVDVDLRLAESALINERIEDVNVPGEEAEVEIFLSGWSSSTGDADWGIRPIFATESRPPLNYNVAYYSNPAVDALIREGLSSADPAIRSAAYAKVQTLIWEDAPVIVRMIGNVSWATSRKVINVSNFPDGQINLRAGRMAP
jgi:glutathione transport system substrate-binding protein